jgi:hypothetical protein
MVVPTKMAAGGGEAKGKPAARARSRVHRLLSKHGFACSSVSLLVSSFVTTKFSF